MKTLLFLVAALYLGQAYGEDTVDLKYSAPSYAPSYPSYEPQVVYVPGPPGPPGPAGQPGQPGN